MYRDRFYLSTARSLSSNDLVSTYLEYFIDSIDIFGDEVIEGAEDAGVVTDKQARTALKILDSLHKKANKALDLAEAWEGLVQQLGLDLYIFRNKAYKRLNRTPVYAAKRGSRSAFGSVLNLADSAIRRQASIFNDMHDRGLISDKEYNMLDRSLERLFKLVYSMVEQTAGFLHRPGYQAILDYVDNTPRNRAFDFPFKKRKFRESLFQGV